MATYFNGLLESTEIEDGIDGKRALRYVMQTGETPTPVLPWENGQEYRILQGILHVRTDLNPDWQAYSSGEVCTIVAGTKQAWLKVEEGIAEYLRVELVA